MLSVREKMPDSDKRVKISGWRIRGWREKFDNKCNRFDTIQAWGGHTETLKQHRALHAIRKLTCGENYSVIL